MKVTTSQSYIEKDKISSEVKSIQSRQSVKAQILYESKHHNQKKASFNNNIYENEAFKSDEENKVNQNFMLNDDMNDKSEINRDDFQNENKEESPNKKISTIRSDKTESDHLPQKFNINNNNADGDFASTNPLKLSNHLSGQGFDKSGLGFREKESQIVQIVKGKYHLLKLTLDGKVYGSGKSYYGVVGLGGSGSAVKPELLPNLANLKIKQISAGVYHSLALAQNGDLYTWGLGEEGMM